MMQDGEALFSLLAIRFIYLVGFKIKTTHSKKGTGFNYIRCYI